MRNQEGDGVEIFFYFYQILQLFYVCPDQSGSSPSFIFFFFIYFYSKHFVSYFSSHTVPLIFDPFDIFSLFYYFSINYSSIQIFWYQNHLKTGVKCYRGPKLSFLVSFDPFDPFLNFLLLFLKLHMNTKILIPRSSKSVENWGLIFSRYTPIEVSQL